jgi:hypothetical protein
MIAKRSAVLGLGFATLLAACTEAGSSDEAAVQLGGVKQALSDCATTPGWTHRPYAPGERVLVEGHVYECKPWPFSGWCGNGDPYEPGVGWAWRDAWNEVAPCEAASCRGVPAWTAGTTASSVQADGMKYSCKVAGWCQSPSHDFEPGHGSHGQLAWSRVARCEDGSDGSTRALVLVDARLHGLLPELDAYLERARSRRGFDIRLEAIDGLDDWPYWQVKSHIVAARAENPQLEGVLLVGNIKLPTFYKPRADILDTRIYAPYLEDFDATFDRRLVPGAVDPACGPGVDFEHCAVGGGIVPEHDLDYIAKGPNPGPEIWTSYMPVGVRGSDNTHEDFAAQLGPYLRKVIRYYDGEIVSNGRFYGVSGDRGERFDVTYATWGPERVDFYGKPGPNGERGTACFTPAGQNLCYVRWPLESYGDYRTFDEAYRSAGWVDEGWQESRIFLAHMNGALYDVAQVNVHANEVWSLATTDEARDIQKGALFVGLDGCNVAGFLQPFSPSFVNTWVHVSDNVLMAYLYGSSQAIAASGDPAWRGHYSNLPVVFHAMKHAGQYLGQAHLTRMRANYERASTPYDLKEFANELLVGDPFMKL